MERKEERIKLINPVIFFASTTLLLVSVFLLFDIVHVIHVYRNTLNVLINALVCSAQERNSFRHSLRSLKIHTERQTNTHTFIEHTDTHGHIYVCVHASPLAYIGNENEQYGVSFSDCP